MMEGFLSEEGASKSKHHSPTDQRSGSKKGEENWRGAKERWRFGTRIPPRFASGAGQ
jgi:Ni/Co efflux regulator RcnB